MRALLKTAEARVATRFLEAIMNRDHDEHDSYLEWVGGSFDPTEFDLAGTNERWQGIR
jgi:hypothetical protein